MKRMFRAFLGIAATVLIIVFVERTMDVFEFFPEDKPIEIDSATTVLDSLTGQITTKIIRNNALKGGIAISVFDDKQVKPNRVFNKKFIEKDDSQIINILHKNTIQDFNQSIDVSFEFDNPDLVENILFISLDNYNPKTEVVSKRFFEPQKGKNRVNIKNNFKEEGIYEFRLGYFLKKEALKKNPIFYSQKFKVVIE